MISYVDHHAFAFLLAVALLLVLLFLWLATIASRQQHLRSRIESLLDEVEGGSVPAMLNQYVVTVRQLAGQVESLERQVDVLSRDAPGMVRHVGLVRFSPFRDTGGDQSFAMALLDGRRNGVVVTGLHSRLESKLFAKPVVGGRSRYSLTPEEQRALDQSVATSIDGS